MIAPWLEETLEDPGRLACTVVVLLITFRGLRWLRERRSFIVACNRLPGPAFTGYSPWVCHAQAYVETKNTVPGYPEIPRSISVLYRFHQQFGEQGLFRLWFFNPYRLPFARCTCVVTDPHLVRQLLTEKAITIKIVREKRSCQVVGPLLESSFLMLPDGPKWKHQRKLSASGFNQRFLEFTNTVIVDLLYNKAFAALDSKLLVEQSVTIEALEWTTKMASEILGRVAFSHSFGCFDEEDGDPNKDSIFNLYATLLVILSRRMRMPPLAASFRWQENRLFDEKMKKLDGIVDTVILERLAEHDKVKSINTSSTKMNPDLLSYMLPEEGEDERMSYQDLRACVKMYMFAGQDTTANTLSFALWELGTHPNVQEKLRTEVDDLFDTFPPNEYPSYKDIMSLRYLDAVVKETLRLHSPGIVARSAIADLTLTTKEGKQFDVPKGASLYVFPPVLQQMDSLFPGRSSEWVPERFLDNGKGRVNLENWIPFSVGPRSCVGQPLAVAELKILLAHMIRSYTFRGCREKMKEDPISIILITVKPHQTLIEIRKRDLK